MGNAQAVADYYVTPEEYLADKPLVETRHEYAAGIVYAMSGTSIGHWRIVNNLTSLLGSQLQGKQCEAFSTEIKVGIRTSRAEFYYYPDVVVDCGKHPDDSYFAEEPRVIIEVLSESTERTDRTEKRINYQTLPTLDVYVLVDQIRVAVTVYRRAGDEWITESLTAASDVLDLPTIECKLPLSAIYERTQLLASSHEHRPPIRIFFLRVRGFPGR